MPIAINYNIPHPVSSGSRAVVYARYSSHRQGEQSIDGQLAAAKNYAAARGYTIVHEYIDRAQSGRTDDREAFQQMLSDASRKAFDVIIVWKIDRFGRNRQEITFNKYHCKKHGVRVEYVAENISDGPEGVILESVLEGMAEYYSLQLSQNIRRGNLENAKKCLFTGGRVPLGYKIAPDRSFQVDPDTAPVVQRIFRDYAAGKTAAEIIRELNTEGIRASTGKAFTRNSFCTLLKNEKYIGTYDFKNGEVRVEDALPAIVDKDIFAAVQQKLKSNRAAPSRKHSNIEYLLTGKLFCGECGGMLAGESGISSSGVKYSYYLCTNHKRRKGCKMRAIRQDLIESLVLESAIGIVSDPQAIKAIAEATWQYYQTTDTSQDYRTSLTSQLADVEKAIANIMKAIESGLPFIESTKARIEDLDEQRTSLIAAIADTDVASSFRLTKEHIHFFLSQWRDMDFTDPACQRRLVEVFINSIYVYADRIVINYNYSNSSHVVTLEEMSALPESEETFESCGLMTTKTRGVERIITWFGSVFAITKKLPPR